MLIDTHCHIHYAKAFPEPATTLKNAFETGVERVVVVGVDLEDARLAVQFVEKHENARAIVGIHPTHSHTYKEGQLSELEILLAHPKVLALGEIGLDFHWKDVPPATQYKVLELQLDLAEKLSLPVIFHAREANRELLDVLEARPQRPYLFHCFSGDADDAKRARKLDCYYGVDGPLTYPKAVELRDIVRGLPLDRIVVETDAPYLAPAPHRGKPNEPAYVRYVSEELARCFGKTIEEIEEITTANAVRFFGERLL